MYIYNIHEAKTNLSKLIKQVQAGEEVVIAKAGNPVVEVNVFEKSLKPRKLGLWKNKVYMSDNFNDEDEEINKLFYEGE